MRRKNTSKSEAGTALAPVASTVSTDRQRLAALIDQLSDKAVAALLLGVDLIRADAQMDAILGDDPENDTENYDLPRGGMYHAAWNWTQNYLVNLVAGELLAMKTKPAELPTPVGSVVAPWFTPAVLAKMGIVKDIHGTLIVPGAVVSCHTGAGEIGTVIFAAGRSVVFLVEQCDGTEAVESGNGYVQSCYSNECRVVGVPSRALSTLEVKNVAA